MTYIPFDYDPNSDLLLPTAAKRSGELTFYWGDVAVGVKGVCAGCGRKVEGVFRIPQDMVKKGMTVEKMFKTRDEAEQFIAHRTTNNHRRTCPNYKQIVANDGRFNQFIGMTQKQIQDIGKEASLEIADRNAFEQRKGGNAATT